MRVLVCLVVMAASLGATDAEACSCVARTFAQHAKAEQRVFLARAGKPEKTGDALKQTFTVLATFKGPADAQFAFDRPATPPCASSYADGEVAILFTSGGDLDPCHGNVPLEAQLDELPGILAATGIKPTPAKADAVEVALREVLSPYLHDRPVVAVRHGALAGTSLQIGKSKLTYSAKGKDLEIKRAIATPTIAFVQGTYKTEGVRFSVLLVFDKTWKVARAVSAER